MWIIYYVVLVLVPMVPAIVFAQNAPDIFKDAHIDIGWLQGGGGAAIYFGLVYLGYLIFFRTIGRDLIKRHKVISGNWDFVASDPGQNETRGTASVSIVRDPLGLIVSGTWLDEQNRPKGTWRADEVLLREGKLIYLFEVASQKDGGSLLQGITSLSFTPDKGKVRTMQGPWSMLGMAGRGSVTYTRSKGTVTRRS